MSTTVSRSDALAPLRRFVREMTRLLAVAEQDEAQLLAEGGQLLRTLVATDDWLPERFARPSPEHYQQYLLHCDPLERFSVVSFVWGPGQRTPIHDHTVWGLVGMLRGAERAVSYQRNVEGGLKPGAEELLRPGEVEAVSPTVGDIHAVSNALADGTSISIHVYGANIGTVQRHVYDPASGARKSFVSGYALDVLPNLWNQGGLPQA